MQAKNIALVTSSAAAPFFDGFLVAAVAFSMASLWKSGAASAAHAGSLYVLGTCLGGILLPVLADRTGRRPMLLASSTLLLAVLLLLAARPSAPMLLAASLLSGFLMGGDLPVSQALLTEALEERFRSRALCALLCTWFAGALCAIGAVCASDRLEAGWSGTYGLVVPAALAALCLRMRFAREPSRRTSSRPSAFRELSVLFSPGMRRPLVFCLLFCSLQIVPATVVLFFAPLLIGTVLGNSIPIIETSMIYICFLSGSLLTLSLKPSSYRPMAMATFLSMGLGLAGSALLGDSSPMLALAAFVVYAFSYGMQSAIDYVLPNRLFPDEHRAKAAGLVIVSSRIAASGAALAAPVLLATIGSRPLLLTLALLSLLGSIIVYREMRPLD